MKLRVSLVTVLLQGLIYASICDLRALELGQPAPPIQVSQWVHGNPVNFDSGRGSNVFVVDFWATTCAPCRYTIPYLGDMQKKYRDRGVIIVGISSEPAEKVKSGLSKLGTPVKYA